MTLISLLLLAALLPYLSHSASVNVGIVNGTEAKPHSRPYMVSIQKDGRHICGGFLVSKKFVMTAAHCWKNEPKLTVVLGAHDLSKSSEGSFRMDVKFYYRHRQFNPHTLDYDIMLLKLRRRVRRTRTVSWISIPQRDEDIPANTVCSVAGWGRTGAFRPPANRLLETRTTIIDRRRCAYYWNNLTQRMVCAHYPGGSCQGDSGGPLVCNNVVVGIVSFGEQRCDSTARPNVYARISAFLPWIRSIIARG
ncbi:complement factor D-like [Colossoma macropomum]|uniref:complement factor D-like n=1 Tax=Colossoma macropomum TaxID=42526 RepID=UPI00186444A0|nr:complement factor D-like [Colossoma macropomum]